MKTLILVLIALLSFSQIHAQESSMTYEQPGPGDQLIKATNTINMSFLLTGFGLISSVVAMNTKDNFYNEAALVFSITGFIVFIVGIQNIGKAGRMMNNKMGMTFDNGIGIRYRI